MELAVETACQSSFQMDEMRYLYSIYFHEGFLSKRKNVIVTQDI